MKVVYRNSEKQEAPIVTGRKPGTYLLMHDPDAPSAKNMGGTWVHWIVDASGITLLDYKGPSPPPGTGTHRYFFTEVQTLPEVLSGRVYKMPEPSGEVMFEVTANAKGGKRRNTRRCVSKSMKPINSLLLHRRRLRKTKKKLIMK